MKLIARMLLFVSFILAGCELFSSPVRFEPALRILPDGRQVQFYISGDEFFNYLHDENGFPVREGPDGYYYYQVQKGDRFIITALRAGYDDPSIDPEIRRVSVPSTVQTRREEYQSKMAGSYFDRKRALLTKSSGSFNNLVICIKFSDESGFSRSQTDLDLLFNNLELVSVRSYYRDVSGGSLDLVSYNFPDEGTGSAVYSDIYRRAYYKPYDAGTNTSGYRNDSERTEREHGLLERAVVWASSRASLPQGVNFDADNNGVFDNVSFIISGTPDGWSDLLWPHRWELFSRTVKIGSLRVGGYTFQMTNASVKTLSHELFHSLGAPDLYRYDNDRVPVGPWDIMASGEGHPCAWMKYKYGGWISEIPEITRSGTYTLKLSGSDGVSAIIIKSPYSDEQVFVAEYRKQDGMYESKLPASGLTLYRIDKRCRGNADGPPDEIYIFRQNGSINSDGMPKLAVMPGASAITSFNDTSNPFGFLQDGTYAGLDVFDIADYGDSLTFSVNVDKLALLKTQPVSYDHINVSWKAAMGGDFIVAVSDKAETLNPVNGKPYNPGDTVGDGGTVIYRGSMKFFPHSDLESDETYHYTVWGVTDDIANSYTQTVTASGRTGIFFISVLPHIEDFDVVQSSLPKGWKSSLGTEGWKPDFSGTDPAITLVSSADEKSILYAPGFQLTGGLKYAITFSYKNATRGINESLFLTEGKERDNLASARNPVFASQNFSLSGEVMYRVLIRPESSGIHYLGFIIGTGSTGVVLNNFRIEAVPELTMILTDPASFYPNPGNGLITVPATARTSVTVYSTTGNRLYVTEIEGMKQIDLRHLGRGIYIIEFTTGEASSSRKLVIN